MAEPIETSSLYSGAPLFSFRFGVQFNVGYFLRPVYAQVFLRCLLYKVLTEFSSFLGEGPQFTVVEEYTCNICIESPDCDCVADFSAVNNNYCIQCFEKASIARMFLRLMSFSVSSKLQSNLHFLHFPLPCRIISFIFFCLRFVDHQIAFCED